MRAADDFDAIRDGLRRLKGEICSGVEPVPDGGVRGCQDGKDPSYADPHTGQVYKQTWTRAAREAQS